MSCGLALLRCGCRVSGEQIRGWGKPSRSSSWSPQTSTRCVQPPPYSLFQSGGGPLSLSPGLLAGEGNCQKRVHSRPVKGASSHMLYHWVSCRGSWGSDQETTCPICNNLATTFFPASGSLGRWSCGQEIVFNLQTWVALPPHWKGYPAVSFIALWMEK